MNLNLLLLKLSIQKMKRFCGSHLQTSVYEPFSSDQHNNETSSSTQGNLTKLFYKTNRYRKYSITVSTIGS